MSNCFGVQFKLVWFYYAQRRAGRPRSSPFPLRGKFFPCREAANMWYNEGLPTSLKTENSLMPSSLISIA
ncbi:MAG: hypothetical protein LBQ66_01585 [Planctomycetaceae bacterium]|nr:hypothetical protein [Planctomycetaceae bacterium]